MRRYLFFILLVLALSAEMASADSDKIPSPDQCYSTTWPHERSELAPDPDLYFGRLENGFRYVLKTNNEPKNRVGVYLNVEAGSLYEQDNERGLAHFLEHLLFNGTTHFPPGELINYFQSIGMGFGADVNGYTTYTDTVYKLILPLGSAQSLDKGFLVMRDYADGALLLDEEIERERGVIMAERTARDSASYRSSVARTSFIFRGTPLPARQPIGDKQILATADRDDLQGFYQRWYRPDNMILVVVGDFNRREAEDLIVKHFDSMIGVETGDCPEYGSIDLSGIESFYHYEPELGTTDIVIETVGNKISEYDSFELQKENIFTYMVTMIINQRLNKLRESVDTSFISAGYYDTVMFDLFRLTGIRARTQKEAWRESLAQIDEVLRQVVNYGFLDDEVERVKKDLLADLTNRVESADTRNSLHLINQIIAHLDANRVLQSPEQELELYGPVIEGVEIDDLNRLVKKRWADEVRIVQLIGDAVLQDQEEDRELLTYYREINSRPSPPPEYQKSVSFPYLAVTGQGSAAEKTTGYDSIEVHRSDFRHGLILNTKVTTFKDNQVRAALHFGDGIRSLPKDGLDQLASAIINGSGTGTLKKSELQDALAGTSVQFNFRVGPESFVLEGEAVSSETELLFQVLHTLLNDPGFRKSVYQISMKNFESMYQRLGKSIEGGAALFLPPFFTGDAPGAGLPSWDEFSSLQLGDVVSWLEPYFKKAPLELSVVGDFDPQRVEYLASKYFDSPESRTFAPPKEVQADFPRGQQIEVMVDSSIDKTLIRFGWLTDDFSDIKRTRRLSVLANVLEDRLRQKIREDLGASYSPSAYSSPSRIYPDYGVIYAELIVDRQSVETALQAVEEIGASFADRPVDEDELQRIKEPILTSLKDLVRSNGYWLHSVLSLSSREADQLSWPLHLISDYRLIEPAEINNLAQLYLKDKRRAWALVTTVTAGKKPGRRLIDQGADRAGVFPDDNG